MSTTVEKRAIDVQPGDTLQMWGLKPRRREVLRTTLSSDGGTLTLTYADGYQEIVPPLYRLKVLSNGGWPMSDEQRIALLGDVDKAIDVLETMAGNGMIATFRRDEFARLAKRRRSFAMSGTTCRTCGSRPASDGCCGQCHLRRSCHCFRTAANASSAQGNQR